MLLRPDTLQPAIPQASFECQGCKFGLTRLMHRKSKCKSRKRMLQRGSGEVLRSYGLTHTLYTYVRVCVCVYKFIKYCKSVKYIKYSNKNNGLRSYGVSYGLTVVCKNGGVLRLCGCKSNKIGGGYAG